jgi:hypothetical protein
MAAEQPSFPDYSNYQRLPSMVLGFHGCDEFVGEQVLSGKVPHLARSVNQYDWLGGHLLLGKRPAASDGVGCSCKG